MTFPNTLKEAVGLALRFAAGPQAKDVMAKRLEDFLADKFQSHMTGMPNFDIPLQKLFEDITGRKITRE